MENAARGKCCVEQKSLIYIAVFRLWRRDSVLVEHSASTISMLCAGSDPNSAARMYLFASDFATKVVSVSTQTHTHPTLQNMGKL